MAMSPGRAVAPWARSAMPCATTPSARSAPRPRVPCPPPGATRASSWSTRPEHPTCMSLGPASIARDWASSPSSTPAPAVRSTRYRSTASCMPRRILRRSPTQAGMASGSRPTAAGRTTAAWCATRRWRPRRRQPPRSRPPTCVEETGRVRGEERRRRRRSGKAHLPTHRSVRLGLWDDLRAELCLERWRQY